MLKRFSLLLLSLVLLPVSVPSEASASYFANCVPVNPYAVFVNSNFSGAEETGRYAKPYNSLEEALLDLSVDSSLDTLCLKGDFEESLDLNDVASPSLHVSNYDWEEVSITDAYPVLHNSLGSLSELTLDSINLNGRSYLTNMDRLVLDTMEFNGDGAWTALTNYEVDEVAISRTSFTNVDYAAYQMTGGLILNMTDVEFSGLVEENVAMTFSYISQVNINKVSVEDPHTKSVLLSEIDGAAITESSFKGYSDMAVDYYAYTGGSLALEKSQFGTLYEGGEIALSLNNVDLNMNNNYIVGNEVGLEIYANSGLYAATGTHHINHNTFRNNDTGISLIEGTSTMRNNLFSGSGDQFAFGESIDTNVLHLDSDYNLFHDLEVGEIYANLFGVGAHSLFEDPLFINQWDLHVLYGSPVRYAGEPVAGITEDFDGDVRPYVPSIGADDF